jgi:hypothetical protein
MAVTVGVEHARSGETGQASAAGEAEQHVLDDIIDMMRGAEDFETEVRALMGEESVTRRA